LVRNVTVIAVQVPGSILMVSVATVTPRRLPPHTLTTGEFRSTAVTKVSLPAPDLERSYASHTSKVRRGFLAC